MSSLKPVTQSEKRGEQKKPNQPLDKKEYQKRIARRWPIIEEVPSWEMEHQEQIRQEGQADVAAE